MLLHGLSHGHTGRIGRLTKIAANNQETMPEKAAIFQSYRAAVCRCLLSGSIDGEAGGEIALLMFPGSLDWTRTAVYKNPGESMRIDLIQIVADGKLVKAYSERAVTLVQGDSLRIKYVPSCLWISAGRIDCEVVSPNGTISATFSTL